ncbi:uncharacterized protein LOC128556937 [Mercenaria mercenaria]|uniref:uncharacterized protein LOC128556937 n=1 Tax=Mercenaria mercenaria TaxID=6596 RepID=UPI00234FB185|nr:uncharacterized protein LOC128556937 [Mercenaria mercenaria]
MMRFARFTFLIGIIIFLKEQPCYEAKSCSQYKSRSSKTCSYWSGRWGCKRKYSRYRVCCDGYTGSSCSIPRCRMGYGKHSCNVRNEGYVKYRDGTVVRDSGGECYEPSKCRDCNRGYYPVSNSNGFCKACFRPANCNQPVCTRSDDYRCEYCVGEYIRDKPGYNIYTGNPDDRRCQRACSWQEGARCFPGTCSNDTYMILDTDCKCATGFGGKDCATAAADEMPTIKDMHFKLQDCTDKIFLADKALNESIFWTKNTLWSRFSLEATANYVPKIDSLGIPNYIIAYDIGIETMTLNMTLSRGTDIAVWNEDGGCTNFAENCDKTFSNETIDSINHWKKIYKGQFEHADKIKFEVSAKTGGKVLYEDRSTFTPSNYKEKQYFLNGIVRMETFEIGFDEYPPAHCFEDSINCTEDALIATDFLIEPKVTVHWNGWTDGDSGIDKYEFNIYYLHAATRDGPLTNKYQLPAVIVPSSHTSVSLDLKEPGPYSVEIIVHDRAENYKVARRIILFDSASVVELNGNKASIVQAQENGWINKYSNYIEISWPGRFRNVRHDVGGWLNDVQEIKEVGRELDDREGRSNRTVDNMFNIEGIVRVDIARKVELNGDTKNFNFERVIEEYFRHEKMVYNNEEFIDGKKLTYFIRAVDAVGEYAEDNVTAMIDMSPPIITNVWLTKGDLINISVHSVLELKELTIEWEAFDYHSGIQEVSWKIFDNFTKNVVVHGQSHETPQGETETLDKCNQNYGLYARGPNCYCSPYNGCFHRHFQIKPQVSVFNNSGIHFGQEVGEHEYDYFIEVTVKNGAELTSVLQKKITIDTSPPHEGTVHDGMPGDPEVDFQQSLQLTGNWDGFFDKESGVWFYTYGFNNRCLSEYDLDIHLKVNWTYEKKAEFSAPKSGKYYLTIMAYNHALDHSKPVCSDGVTVDVVPAVISEVAIKDAVTTSGLVRSDVNDTVYILHRYRVLEEVELPTNVCRNRSTTLSESILQLYPHRRRTDGTISYAKLHDDCNGFHGLHSDLISYITSDSRVDISWNVTYSAGGVHDYEVGIASTNSKFPDIMDFASSHHHQHMRLFHPNIFDGEQFYVLIKAITKASVSDIKVVGPIVYDSSKPDFTGEILLSVEHTQNDTFLIAQWDENAFTDHGDPNALSYQVAVGTTRNGKDLLSFDSLSAGGSCTIHKPPSCTAISTHSLPWHMHGELHYFVTIKVRDTVGLFVTASSTEYRHYIELASQGVVQDIDDDSTVKFVDIDDIDYQTSTSKLTTRWSGFEHPYEDIIFTVCISNASSSDYMTCAQSDVNNKHTFSGLNLNLYETYYHTVIAGTEAGNVTAVSDGITVVVDGDEIDGILVFDGPPCNVSLNEDLNIENSYHDESKRLLCRLDADYQASTNVLQAHWTIPDDRRVYLNDIYWAIEERAPVADIWKTHSAYQHLRTTASYLEESGLFLSAGRTYRVSLKFCARQFCFKPVHSNGVTIVPNPPTTGSMSVTYTTNKTTIEVSLDPFMDSDIEDVSLSREVMDHYEWAFIDESTLSRLLTKWQRITLTDALTGVLLQFTIDLPENIAFTKCWILAIRGYTKAGLSSTISSEIRNCQDLQQVRPNFVIDAVGKPLSTENDHVGTDIFLEDNAIWKESDKDYTPYSNILSAVWPTLRYTHYAWAVLLVTENDPTVFYDRSNKLNLRNPCDHPDAIKCGETAYEYVNVKFGQEELTHGRRYIICIHANASKLQREFWEQDLGEIDECSNGVTVDLTPPVTTDVWIGNDKQHLFQTSTSEVTVHWNSFTDVEEEGFATHISGITHYQVALGTTTGGVDVKPFTDVGLTNHKTFHNLKLQNGHTYFATVLATDFTGQFSSSGSEGIKVDITPPTLTEASITLPSRHISDTQFVDACWRDVFVDIESGVSHYSWAVGTHAGYDDIYLFHDTVEECTNTPENTPLSLREGHGYFVTVKAYNKAGLYSATSSWAFVVDVTPPVPGKVYDGHRERDGSCVDVDYVESRSSLHAHWKGFHDPHSTVVEYFVNIGSCKNCDDVLIKQPVGIKTDIEYTHLQLSEGLHYYVTVTACNTANLCSSVTSDGFVVDSTPPLKGRVIDGLLETDEQYQSSRNYLGCKWHGFTDPQSGISHYVWRVGTTKGDDNILPATEVHQHREAFIFDLQSEHGTYLPKDVRIYCTVRAYNRAGRFVEASSNGFIVDDTAPIFATRLSMSSIGSIKSRTTVLRNTLKVHWDVIDEESFIKSQHLSISSHIGGDFNLSSIAVEGIVRDYTFTNLDLHDGNYYCIKLISCNGANLCTKSVLEDILVDSSRPTPGTFAVNTDHAAVLNRQPEGWMTWTAISIDLSWLGFEDVHSEIHTYTVNIGSQYMDNDLNEVPYTPMTVTHNINASFHEEGKVQTFRFLTQRLHANMAVYVSVTAENHVGLSSAVVHSQFNLLYGGIMELVRRCDSYSCLGHCVCAPNGKMCHSNYSCIDSSGKDNNNTIIEVVDYLDLQFPDNYLRPSHSPINTMLGARWNIKILRGNRPMWYEWSVGDSFYDSPIGVFDTKTDKVWHDAGHDNSCVFTVDRGRKVLEEHKTYSVFVRVWYNSYTFAIFKSVGVTIFHTPPLSIVIKGKNVKEVVKGTTRDIDFITRNTHVDADWSGKFGGEISRYHLYISTHPGGHDLRTVSKDLLPTVTNVNITGLQYEENTKYYTVVQAFNLAGLHTTEVSDGFMLDLEPPTPGLVMDGLVLHDKHATANTSRVQSFWYGFSDIGSGIQTYEYCVSSGMIEGTCDLKTLSPVGIATRIEFYPSVQLKQGTMVRGEVRARDVTGHVSSQVSSNGVIIDTTAPVRAQSVECLPNILLDSSFENITKLENNGTVCENISDSPWNLSSGTCVSYVKLKTALHDGTLLHIQGSISQTVNTEIRGKYRLTFFTSTIPSNNLHLSAVEGYTQVNGQRYVFMLYSKPNTNTYAWQKHVFFFHLTTTTTEVELGTVNIRTAFAIDGIRFQLCEVTTYDETAGHVNFHTVFVHDWSSVHADWSFIDPETDILEYMWAIGTVQGGTQLQPFVSVGRQTFASNNALRLEHGTVVFLTVVAVNAAGLRTVSYSDPILIDLTLPECKYVNDGPLLGQDLDFIRGNKLDFHWDISDPDSGLKECYWALGTSEGDVSILDFVRVQSVQMNASKLFQTIPDGKVYVTVRCTNGAGSTHTCSSDGVKMVQMPPSVDNVILELLPTSATQYKPRGRYHGNNTEIRFRWTGFDSDEGVQSYLIALAGDQISVSEIVEGSSTGYSYGSFTDLNIDDGEYTVSVTGINEVKMYSQKISANFVLVTQPPSLTGTSVITTWTKRTSTAAASWDNVFVSTDPMYFEVSARIVEGGEGDLVQWQETVDSRIEIVLDTSEMPRAGVTVRFSVRAISYSGWFKIAQNSLFVLP